MSVESAKAFCARMMSDDEFRDQIGSAECANCIGALLKTEGYSFGKNDLLRVVGDLMGKKISADELTAMVVGIYQEEIQAKGKGSVEAVENWLQTLA